MDLQPRTDADWKRIYYVLLNANGGRDTFDWNNIALDWNQVSSQQTGMKMALGYLPALLVLVELYGEPKWNRDMWSSITSTDVFDYLLRIGISLDPRSAARALHPNVDRGDLAMTRRLLDWLGEDAALTMRHDLQDALEGAISSGFLRVSSF